MFNTNIKIGSSWIGRDHPVYVVAEVSCNHNNSLEKATELLSRAKAAGANAVKFQSYRASSLTLKTSNPDFSLKNSSPWRQHKTLYSLFESAAMPWEWHETLFREAKILGIDVFSSAFCLEGVELLDRLDTVAFKIASPEVYHYEVIEACMLKRRPVIISLGVADLNDIQVLVRLANRLDFKDLILLKCTASYPADLSSLNIAVIKDLHKKFGCVVGFSDHSLGHAADIVAVASGAKVIEKHIRLDADDGIDGFFSTSVNDFRVMVEKIRETESILGTIDYSIPEEVKEDYRGRRSLFYVKTLDCGDIINAESIAVLRPAGGLHPKYQNFIFNKKIERKVEPGSRVLIEDVDNIRVKISIVGLGEIGMGSRDDYQSGYVRSHLAYVLADPRFKLITGVDPSLERRAMFNELTGILPFEELADCLDLLAESDIIVFAEPTRFRLDNVSCLAPRLSGKKFILEKPIAQDLESARLLKNILSQSNNRVFVNYQRRTYPFFDNLRRRLTCEGRITAHCKYTGSFNHIGTHFLDLFLFLTGDEGYEKEMLGSGDIRLIRSGVDRLIMEQLIGDDYYTMDITTASSNFFIDFNDGMVKIFDRNRLESLSIFDDNHFYFCNVGDELVRLHAEGNCLLPPFEKAYRYLE